MMLPRDCFVVYGATGHHNFDQQVLYLFNKATNSGLDFSHIHHSTWTDGEPGFCLARPDKVTGRHVIVFACPITYKLYNQLQDIIIACHHQYGAKSITVVMSFLRFRRQDHPEKTKEITRLRWFMQLLKFWGTDQLVVCEPHNIDNTQEFCKAAGIELFIADPTRLFANAITGLVQTLGGKENVVVYSPDFGSAGRALNLAQAIGSCVVAAPKRRVSNRVELVEDPEFLRRIHEKFGDDVEVSCRIMDVVDKHVLVREDEVASGGTARPTAKRLKEAGAKSIHLLATHPVCTWSWKTVLLPEEEERPFASIWLGNTRPRGIDETEYEGSTGGVVEVVDMAPIMAETLIEVLGRITD